MRVTERKCQGRSEQQWLHADATTAPRSDWFRGLYRRNRSSRYALRTTALGLFRWKTAL